MLPATHQTVVVAATVCFSLVFLWVEFDSNTCSLFVFHWCLMVSKLNEKREKEKKVQSSHNKNIVPIVYSNNSFAYMQTFCDLGSCRLTTNSNRRCHFTNAWWLWLKRTQHSLTLLTRWLYADFFFFSTPWSQWTRSFIWLSRKIAVYTTSDKGMLYLVFLFFFRQLTRRFLTLEISFNPFGNHLTKKNHKTHTIKRCFSSEKLSMDWCLSMSAASLFIAVAKNDNEMHDCKLCKSFC